MPVLQSVWTDGFQINIHAEVTLSQGRVLRHVFEITDELYD